MTFRTNPSRRTSTPRSSCLRSPNEWSGLQSRTDSAAMMTDREDAAFALEEATIAQLHAAIRSGKTTLVEVVQRYIDRARAYNGASSLLLTEDGAAVPE